MACRIARTASGVGPDTVFPLNVSANGRYLVTSRGQPFFFHGDTPWSLIVQLTDNQISTYLTDRAAKGYSAILFNLIEHRFSSQTPEYLNVDGIAPLSSMPDFGSAIQTSYINRALYVASETLARDMACVINPAYLGYLGTEEGWDTEVAAESDADLFSYGSRLAYLFAPYPNVIWCMGGDQTPGTTLRDKQLKILEGIQSVTPWALWIAHAAPQTPSFPTWGANTTYRIHTAYPETGDVFTHVQTEYTRSPPMPATMIEAIYEQERSPPISAAGLRRQSYIARAAGASLVFFGWNPGWHFESPNAPFTYTGTWQTNLNSTGNQHQAYHAALYRAYAWWKLEPKTGTELVTTSLSTGDTRIGPQLATDGSFAFIWKPSSGASTVNMAAMSPSSVKAQFYDPTAGTFSAVSGSPFANSGTQSITWPGERVLVLEAA